MSKRYISPVFNEYLTTDAEDIDDFIQTYVNMAAMLIDWKKAGIQLDTSSAVNNDCAFFYTEDPEVAETFHFDTEECPDCGQHRFECGCRKVCDKCKSGGSCSGDNNLN